MYANPFAKAADQNPQNRANLKDVKLRIVPEALSIIAGQSATIRIELEKNGFREPVEILAADLPEGFSVEFEDNPTEGDFINVRIFSPLINIDWESVLNFRIKYVAPKYKVRLLVNCDVEWVKQHGSAMQDASHNLLSINQKKRARVAFSQATLSFFHFRIREIFA